MTAEEFQGFWEKEYPETFPISHELKWAYPERWFRIHSLPASKRYADSEEEYNIILSRQNQLIEDIIGEGKEVILLFGLFMNDLSKEYYERLSDFIDFKKVWTIDLHQANPKEYEEETFYDIYIKTDIWKRDSRNELLLSIADDQTRALIICPSTNCIIAPYDGGVDVILDSTQKRDQLKANYKSWLSEREDGM